MLSRPNRRGWPIQPTDNLSGGRSSINAEDDVCIENDHSSKLDRLKRKAAPFVNLFPFLEANALSAEQSATISEPSSAPGSILVGGARRRRISRAPPPPCCGRCAWRGAGGGAFTRSIDFSDQKSAPSLAPAASMIAQSVANLPVAGEQGYFPPGDRNPSQDAVGPSP